MEGKIEEALEGFINSEKIRVARMKLGETPRYTILSAVTVEIGLQ